jgi:hypothetical protein
VDGPVDVNSLNDSNHALQEYLDALDNDPLANRPQKKVPLIDPMS